MSGSRIALITGGSSGIGFAIAQRFIVENYTVIIVGRNMDKLNQAASALGDACIGLQFDLANLDQIGAFVTTIKERFGRIDVLVNNAGINQKKEFLKTTFEDFESIVRINQSAQFELAKAVVQVMLHQENKGSIINISSMAAHYGIPYVISYTASKSAIEGMTRAMAVELSPLGIRVNCVAPGFIKTAMSSKALNDDIRRVEKILSRTPMGKLGLPEDVANSVYFLASDQASYITGEVLKVDGGNSIGF